jgi:hypothetical protein
MPADAVLSVSHGEPRRPSPVLGVRSLDGPRMPLLRVLWQSAVTGYCCFASASETAGTMITSWPGFQFTGVATLCLAVSWQE